MEQSPTVHYCHWCADAGLVVFGHNGYSLLTRGGTIIRWSCADHRQAGKKWSRPEPITPGPEPKQKPLI